MGCDTLTDSGKGQPQDHIPGSGDNNLIKEEPLLLFLRLIINMRSEDSLSVELNRKKLLGARIKALGQGESGNSSESISQHCLVKDFWSL